MSANGTTLASVPSAQAPIRGSGTVLSNRVDGAGRKLRLRVDGWPGAWPGQFVMVGAGPLASVPRWEPLLPRPMAVYRDVEVTGGAHEVERLYRVVGGGTTLLSAA